MSSSNSADQLKSMMKTIEESNRILHELLLVRGLYQSIDTQTEVGAAALERIRKASTSTFDCYCTGCKKETPFIISDIPVHNSGGGLRDGNALYNPPMIYGLRAVCQRDLTTYTYAFRIIGNNLIKIGQEPSMADIAFGELKDLDKSLDQIDRKELGKAIGLFSHDAASGAFVYLRRVFERMIGRAHDRISATGRSVPGFDTMRMEEKITALKTELPERLVRNKSVFSVLSAGIHELTDEQCTHLFPVVKAVIFQMLEQEEHKRRQALAEREADVAFDALLSSGAHVSER